MPELTDVQLAELDGSPRMADRTAAAIARMLAGQPEGTPVESETALAVKLQVSGPTVGIAKRLLARYGVITKSKSRYYVH